MDETLISKAMQGDADAFGTLVGPYEGLVYRQCLLLLKNPADAQDAAQETMLRAYRAMPRFLGLSSVPTWLYRIAHNVCLDWLKRPRTRRENASLDGMAEAGFDPADPAPTPEDAYVQQSDRARLREALLRLPADWQALLLLRYGEGLSYEAIARALRLREGTVKSRLNRAKEKLHALMKD